MKTNIEMCRRAIPVVNTQQPESHAKEWAKWLALETDHDPKLLDLARACGRFARAVRHNAAPRWLTILGPTGTGKTHCARVLWNKLAQGLDWQRAQHRRQFIYWPAFVEQLRRREAGDLATDLQRWPLLVLDDVCAERDPTGFGIDALNTLLGCRPYRWTIITSNLSLGQIAEREPRIADRMIRGENILVRVDCESYSIERGNFAE